MCPVYFIPRHLIVFSEALDNRPPKWVSKIKLHYMYLYLSQLHDSVCCFCRTGVTASCWALRNYHDRQYWQSILIGLCFCCNTPPAVTLPNKIHAHISSPFGCPSTFTSFSKVEKQNINNTCTRHPWKTLHILLLLSGMVILFFTGIMEGWRGWTKLLDWKMQGKISEPGVHV